MPHPIYKRIVTKRKKFYAHDEENKAKTGVFLNVFGFGMGNLKDDTMSKLAAAPWVLVVEGWNVKTGLGSRLGTELLKRGFAGKYNNIGTNKEGSGGLWQQMGYQGLDSAGIGKALALSVRASSGSQFYLKCSNSLSGMK